MKVQFFTVPIHEGGSELEALNQFLASHRVVKVEQEFVAEGMERGCAVFDRRSESEGLNEWGCGVSGGSLVGGTGWAFVGVGKGGSKLPRSMGRPVFGGFLECGSLLPPLAVRHCWTRRFCSSTDELA